MASDNIIPFSIKAVDNFTKPFKTLGKTLVKTTQTIKRVGIGIAGAGAALTAFVTLTENGIDRQVKFATRLGISVTELSKLQFAAQQSGIEVQTMNLAVQRMTRRVAEAAQGLGEAKGALSELNINARQFKNLALDEQMFQLASAIEKVEDPADQLRLAFKLFDSEGTAVLQMLKGGSEAMRAMAADAEFLGVAISQKSARSAVDFTDQMGRAKSAMVGVSRAVSDDLAPIMAGLAKTFANSLASNRENIVLFVKSAVTGLFTAFELFRQFGTQVFQIFNDPAAFDAFINNMAQLPGQVLDLALAMGRFIALGIFEGVKLSMEIFTSFGTWLGQSVANIVNGQEVQSLGDVMGQRMLAGLQLAREKMGAEFDLLTQDIGVAASEIGTTFATSFGINIDAAQNKARETIQGLIEFAATAVTTIDEVAKVGLENLSITKSNYDEWLLGMNVGFTNLANNFRDVMSASINAISFGMAEVLVEGASLSESLKQISKNVLKTLISMLIKLGVQRLIFSGITKTAVTSESSAQLGASNALAFSNAFASTAAIPIIGPALAPGVAAAASAANLAGSAASGAAGAGLGASFGVAHGGLTNVPKESTFLLDKGERVLSPNQNRDFTDFIGGSGAANDSPVTIETVNITITTTAESLSDISDDDIDDFVSGTLIDS